MTKILKSIYIALIFFVSGHILQAQTSDGHEGFKDSISINTDIFDQDKLAEITLKFSFKEYRKNKDNTDYHPAELTYLVSDSLPAISKKVRVRARGNNHKAICSFPPMRLNIKKTEVENKKLTGVKNIKLVTHCKNSKISNTYVLKEYLIYKIYQVISPYSFRVRLTRVNYIDTSSSDKETEAWAFLIEPEKMLADRFDLLSIKQDNLGFKYADPEMINTMAMFNYMIGNADYSLAARHNVKLLKSPDPSITTVIPVPYDFDYAGLVNASYAIPGENLGIKSVTERYFTGPCRGKDAHEKAIQNIVKKKQEILKEIEAFEYLSTKEKQKMTKYLESFFETANQKQFVQRNILSTCTTIK